MWWDLLVALASAVVCAAGCATGPAVLRRLPEPALEAALDTPVDAEPPPEAEPASADSAELAGGKTPYAELGSRRGLAGRLALAGAVAGGLIGWRLGASAALPAWVFLSGLGVVLAYVDAQTRLLPTRLIAPGYAVVIVLLLLAAGLDGNAHHLGQAVLGWLVMGGFYFVMWFVYPRGLGYGDVRLSGLIGLSLGYLGWGALVTGLYAGFLLGGVGGGLLVLFRIVKRRHFPFGPFMLLGALVGLIWGPVLADWYAGR